jgi:type 2 lantibiotic biosynthesis protein LanM
VTDRALDERAPGSTHLTDADLAEIAAAATTLQERLAGAVEARRERGDVGARAARLEAWRDAVVRDDDESFARRLARAGRDLTDVAQLLGPVRLRDPGSLPSWLDTLRQALATASREDRSQAECRFCEPGDPLPFEQLAAPFVLTGRERLQARLGAIDAGVISAQAMSELERLLLGRLTSLSSRALYLAFAAHRAANTSPLGRLLARAAEVPPSRLYDSFIERMARAGGLADLFRQYPVLARLMSQATERWVDATAEFVERLERDRDELGRTFGGADELGPVDTVEPGLSDPHRGGRMVAGVTFSSRVKVVYKPKDLGTEGAYNRLLGWFNAHEAPLPFRVLTLVARPGYGWVEWVEQEACRDADEVGRYYERAGMLLCLVYALAGTDFHRDNLIASGEHPVLIDAESLMHPRPSMEGRKVGLMQVAHDELVTGVLGTGLLPSWQVDDGAGGKPASDVSGLHTADEDELIVDAPRWDGINSDGMALGFGPARIPLPKSQPLLPGEPVRLEDHTAELLEGFERFYRYLLERRAAILEPGSPLHELGCQRVRFLYRNTRIYGSLHHELCDPTYLRDGADRSIRLERLAPTAEQSIRDDAERPLDWWKVFEAERDSMEQLDVPFFTARADSVDLEVAPGAELSRCLREPSAELVMSRIGALGPEDLERQLGFIAGSLHSSTARHGADGPAPGRPAPRRVSDGAAPGSLTELAHEIAAEVAARAIRAEGGVTWIAPQYLPRLERYQLQPVGYDLHSGACGMALFLAAVERTTGGAGYRDLILDALQPLREALADEGQTLGRVLGTGGATGLGSVVYALTSIGRLIDEPTLLNDAAAAAALLTDDRIDGASVDVFEGVAGEALALLALYEAAPEAAVLEQAKRCGRRLLATQSDGAGDGAAWITFQDRRLTGFSHGAAGIAYALLRLARATGDAAFAAAAERAIEYEDRFFDPDADNWRDLREETQPAYKANWCHGAPGIGLARLGGLPILDNGHIRRDVEAAIRTTLRMDQEGPDHLCCGNLGRVDLLLVARRHLDRPDLVDAARSRADRVARRARDAGGFSLHTSLSHRVHMPGFFMGTSGIGYQLLRVEQPEVLSSVLLWE